VAWQCCWAQEDGPVKPVVNSGAARPKPDQPVQRFSEEIPNTAEGEPHKVSSNGLEQAGNAFVDG
jgi:hypothetical protein